MLEAGIIFHFWRESWLKHLEPSVLLLIVRGWIRKDDQQGIYRSKTLSLVYLNGPYFAETWPPYLPHLIPYTPLSCPYSIFYDENYHGNIAMAIYAECEEDETHVRYLISMIPVTDFVSLTLSVEFGFLNSPDENYHVRTS